MTIIEDFEATVKKYKNQLFGIHLYYEVIRCLQFNYNKNVLDTNHNLRDVIFRQIILRWKEAILEAEGLLKRVRSGAEDIKTLKRFEFPSIHGLGFDETMQEVSGPGLDELMRRVTLLVKMYEKLFPDRPRDIPFTAEEIEKLREEIIKDFGIKNLAMFLDVPKIEEEAVNNFKIKDVGIIKQSIKNSEKRIFLKKFDKRWYEQLSKLSKKLSQKKIIEDFFIIADGLDSSKIKENFDYYSQKIGIRYMPKPTQNCFFPPWDKPRVYPYWFASAYPDVIKYFVGKYDEIKTIFKNIGFTKKDLEDSNNLKLIDQDGYFKIEILYILKEHYKKLYPNKKLECQ